MNSYFKRFLLIPISICLLGANLSFNYEDNMCNTHFAKSLKKENELVIYNCADYIDETLIEEFEEEFNCEVHYYTYDTNETMYNQFTLQPKGTYDLICTSDYMIQKMVREGLVEPINISQEIPEYDKYASKEVRGKLASMYADVDGDGIKEASLDNYSVGYMWGTLGIVYDPICSDTIEDDVKSWDIFWNTKYKNLISIKNSMRDTFVVGLMHAYKGSSISGLEDVLTPARQTFLDAIEKATSEDEKRQIRNDYNKIIQDIFDLVITQEDYESILEIVKNELISLKKNIFGFEVDSGKNDIITGKIKMNLAWSGDAVYSIDTALEEANKVLHYSVPEDGANVWYDGWTLPNGSNRDLACEFVDFLSRPENAARNMDYIGYTSFISCDEVFDLVSETYGVSEYFEETSYHGAYYDEEEEEDIEGSIVLYEDKIYRCIKDGEFDVLNILPTNADYWEEVDEDLGISDTPYDLNYLFSSDDTTRDYILYPYEIYENKLETQYPTQDTLARCAIMNDFGSVNEYVVIMWGQLRAYTSMTPYYVILISFATGVLVVALLLTIKKHNSIRSQRRKMKKQG